MGSEQVVLLTTIKIILYFFVENTKDNHKDIGEEVNFYQNHKT